MKIFKITLIFNVLIISSWIIFLTILPKINNKSEVIVPKISGMKVDEAIDLLKEKKLDYKVIYEENETSNIVIRTYPLEETYVKENARINIYISKIKELVWPEFTGLFYNDNKEAIEDFCLNNGIHLKINTIVDNSHPLNIIINQNRKHNTKISEKILILDIVEHDNLIEMPNLVGSNLYDAIYLLNTYKLKYKCIYEYSLLDFNTVLTQSIQPNTKILKGNENIITIYISKGIDIPTNTKIDIIV